MREGTIYTRVSISLITKTFHEYDGGHHQIWGVIPTNKSKVDKYEMLLGEIHGFIARNMDGGDCSLQPGWNPLTINCFVMENPNTASFFHLLSSQNFRSSNLDFQQIIIQFCQKVFGLSFSILDSVMTRMIMLRWFTIIMREWYEV